MRGLLPPRSPVNRDDDAPAFRDSQLPLLPPRTWLGVAVALLAVVLLAVLSWRALEERSRSAEEVRRLGTIVAQVAETMLEAGQQPPVIVSMNVPNGDEHNVALRNRYRDRLQLLKD